MATTTLAAVSMLNPVPLLLNPLLLNLLPLLNPLPLLLNPLPLLLNPLLLHPLPLLLNPLPLLLNPLPLLLNPLPLLLNPLPLLLNPLPSSNTPLGFKTGEDVRPGSRGSLASVMFCAMQDNATSTTGPSALLAFRTQLFLSQRHCTCLTTHPPSTAPSRPTSGSTTGTTRTMSTRQPVCCSVNQLWPARSSPASLWPPSA